MGEERKLSREEVNRLWLDYKKYHTRELKEQLVKHYLPIVRYIAERVADRLPHNVQVEDLVSSGVFGLLEAIERFDLARGVKFESYCTRRVEGAMLDELRNMDWVPRITRQRVNKLESTYNRLMQDFERPPTDTELARAMSCSVRELDQLFKDLNAATLYSVQKSAEDDESMIGMETMVDKRSETPLAESAKKDMLEFIKKHLTTKERYILMLYYFDELTMKEMGLILGLSESRVSQIHAKMIAKLRAYLKRKLNPQEIFGE